MADVILPELAEGVNKAIVTYWHFSVGDQVKEGNDLVEMATDKASFNVPASTTGVVSKVCFGEGEEVKVGDVLAVIDKK